MEPIYTMEFEINDNVVDCHGRLKPSQMLYLCQDMGGRHCEALSLDYEALASRHLFWAVVRHRVQIDRLPLRGETIRVETWPLPTTRTAYPRSVIAYDADGSECFRAISLWVLMDLQTRKMITPGSSGIEVIGTLRGNELAIPGGLACRDLSSDTRRVVTYTDLDRNGHMNNTRCMEWFWDLLDSRFHGSHAIREFTVCYFNEARESEALSLHYGFIDGQTMQLDARAGEDDHRVFSVKAQFDTEA